ncbi:MAG: hypothetical protein GF393_10320 [Armatimonadia bacterium]|nr:hypothetical protein [Armatimonadia bacterium]
MRRSDGEPGGSWEDWHDAAPGQALKQALERARAEQEDIQRRRRRKPAHSPLRSTLSVAVILAVVGVGTLFHTSRSSIGTCTAEVLRGQMTVESDLTRTVTEDMSVTISDGTELVLPDRASVQLSYGCFEMVLGPRTRARLASREFLPRTGSFRLESAFRGLAGMATTSSPGSGAYLRLNTPAAIVTLRCEEPWLAAIHATEDRTVVAVGSGLALVEPTGTPWLARKAREGQLVVATANTLQIGSRAPPESLKTAMQTTVQEAHESWTAHYAQVLVTQVASLMDAVGL